VSIVLIVGVLIVGVFLRNSHSRVVWNRASWAVRCHRELVELGAQVTESRPAKWRLSETVLSHRSRVMGHRKQSNGLYNALVADVPVPAYRAGSLYPSTADCGASAATPDLYRGITPDDGLGIDPHLPAESFLCSSSCSWGDAICAALLRKYSAFYSKRPVRAVWTK
jgi:hypothetical protein